MTDSTSSSVHIAADPGAVLDVIADFEAYSDWADQVEYVLDAGAVKDTYVLEYDWDGIAEDGSGVVSWHLVRAGVLKALDGSYTLTALDGGTRVDYSLAVDVKIPMIGMLKRKAEKVIIDTALKELKKRVESLT